MIRTLRPSRFSLVVVAVAAATSLGLANGLAGASGLPTTAPASAGLSGAGLASAGLSSARPASDAPATVVRVDQVGYPAAQEKIAEIMTSGPEPDGVGWTLVRRTAGGSAVIVASGRTTTDLGRWNGRYRWVWEVAGFSGVHETGSYRLIVAGSPPTASPWFEIAPPADLYAKALSNAVYFYENEMDGPDFVRTALRTAPAHLNDADAMTYRTPPMNGNGNFRGSLARFATGVTVDADGGWWDAGDYLKFVETTSYVVAVMLQGIESFPASLGRSATSSLYGEAAFGTRFLLHMWDEAARTLYYQVGIGEANNRYDGDHDIWRLPQADDHYGGDNPRYEYIRHPPVFRANRAGGRISPNLAGRLTADFALCYRVFRLSDASVAARCLRSAETVYSLAGTNWKGRLLTAAPWSFYPETSWQDDMMLGATELSLALHAGGTDLPAGLPVTSAATYLDDAGRWAEDWVTGPEATSDTLNLYDVSALGDYELDLAMTAEHDSSIGVSSSALLANLRAQIEKSIGVAEADPFRFGFAWDQWDTTTHGAGLSVMANEYDALVHAPVYGAWAERWLDDILGANPWGISLIVGDGSTFPECMQHQVANIVGSLDGRPPVLAGAAVEGPNSFAATGTLYRMRACPHGGGNSFAPFDGHGAVYEDNVQSYSTDEPAIDLTVLTPLAFAWQVAAGTGDLVTPPPA